MISRQTPRNIIRRNVKIMTLKTLSKTPEYMLDKARHSDKSTVLLLQQKIMV